MGKREAIPVGPNRAITSGLLTIWELAIPSGSHAVGDLPRDYLLVESTGIGDSPPLAARRGRRTALTFPDGPPPQKN